ncbi:MAG TPA: hypothetical protein VGF77_05135 [Allosphingosinicella sp.]|jgi:hypothetical protein
MADGRASGAAARLPAFRLKLPERLPDFGHRALIAFRILWFIALALAVAGPVAGTWYRLSDASRNSPLVLGSRAGLALTPDNLAFIRFPVGPQAMAAGIKPGDRIVAIDGVPVSAVVPLPGSAAAAKAKATDADYALFGDLLDGTESRPVAFTIRTPEGRQREITLTTGEKPIEEGARALGIPHWVLSFADLMHLLTYPFLLVSAWVLHRRKEHDLTSSIVSLAILLTLATEQPAASFLELVAHVPPALHRALYDLGNACLLGGILLFPHGRLRPRGALVILALLPLLFVLGGDIYRAAFIAFMGASVLTLVWRLRETPAGDERQQLKWALLGFSGYALFLGTSLVADMMKLGADSLGHQLALEILAGLTFGLAFLLLQLGLLVALMRYRLYDAEAAITRSASVAIIMLAVATTFEVVIEAVKQYVQNEFGQNSGSTGPVVAAAVSTILISPVYDKVQAWSERKFHRKLVDLREGLPDCLRDLRHIAPPAEVLKEVLDRIQAGVRPVRLAAVVEGRIAEARGATPAEVRAWIDSASLDPACTLAFDPADSFFRLRLPLTLEDGACLGWILVGPRPDSSSISAAELDALKDVAGPVTGALRVSLRRERREQGVDEALARQQDRIDALARRLSIDGAGTAA